MFLRLPSVFDRMFMLSLFISLLLMFVLLRQRNELVSFVAIGLSPLMQVKTLMPVVFLTSVLSVIFIDQTLPRAKIALNNWLGSDAFYETELGSTSNFWIADPDAFVEIGSIQGDKLLDVRLYSRSTDNVIESLTIAKTCLLYTSPSPRDATLSRMPSSA